MRYNEEQNNEVLSLTEPLPSVVQYIVERHHKLHALK